MSVDNDQRLWRYGVHLRSLHLRSIEIKEESSQKRKKEYSPETKSCVGGWSAFFALFFAKESFSKHFVKESLMPSFNRR